jgi:hypothetical protein
MTDQNIPSFTGLPRRGRGAERRAFTRHTCSWTVSCYSVLPAEDSRWPATICDVSNRGLRLVACRPFKEGEIIALELVRPVDGLREKLFGRIQHAISEGGVWIAGCRFVNRLSDQEVERLSATKAPLSAKRIAQPTR